MPKLSRKSIACKHGNRMVHCQTSPRVHDLASVQTYRIFGEKLPHNLDLLACASAIRVWSLSQRTRAGGRARATYC